MREFGRKGYLALPHVVAERLLAPADAEIDALVAESPPPVGGADFHSYAYARPAGRLSACDAALRDSPAFRLAEALVSPRTLNHDLHYFRVASVHADCVICSDVSPHLDRSPGPSQLGTPVGSDRRPGAVVHGLLIADTAG